MLSHHAKELLVAGLALTGVALGFKYMKKGAAIPNASPTPTPGPAPNGGNVAPTPVAPSSPSNILQNLLGSSTNTNVQTGDASSDSGDPAGQSTDTSNASSATDDLGDIAQDSGASDLAEAAIAAL